MRKRSSRGPVSAIQSSTAISLPGMKVCISESHGGGLGMDAASGGETWPVSAMSDTMDDLCRE